MMEPPAVASAPARERLSVQNQLSLSALWLGLNFQSSALLPIVVPAQILLLVDRGAVASSSQALAVSAISLGAAIIAIVVTPLAGAASDRMKTRFGRRRQLIVWGIALALIGQAGAAATTPLLLFVAGLAILTIGTNITTAAYQGLLPDIVQVSQRGAASGWLGLMTLIGSVGSLAAAGVLLGSVARGPQLSSEVRHGSQLFYALAAVVLVVSTAITVIGVEERPSPEVPSRPWTELLRHQPFRIVFAARALVMVGLTLFLTYIEYYLASTNGSTTFVGATVAIALLALFGALVSSLALGVLSDRMPRVHIVIGANLAMAAAAWIFVFAPANLPLAPLGILFGLGYGAYLSVDWALAIDSLPGRASSARDLGIFTISINLPSLIAPALGGVVILLANAAGIGWLAYRLVFSLAAVSLLTGVFVVRRIRF
jgi:Na+/melibiose symporter-like transporter